MPRSTTLGVIAAVALLAQTPGALAQQTQMALAVGGGVATDTRGITSNAATVVPMLSWLPDRGLALSLGGSATQFANAQWSLGANGALATRAQLAGPMALTLNALASATGTSYDAHFATAEATPALELRVAQFSAFAGVHTGYGASWSPVANAATPFPLASQPATSMTRTALGPVFGGNATMAGAEESLTIGYREEHMTVQSLTVTDRVASASLSQGRLTLTGTAGWRAAPDERVGFGTGDLNVQVSGPVALDIGAGTYPSNRLTGTPGGRYVSAGISLRSLRTRADAAEPLRLPAPSGAQPPSAGMMRLSIRAADATAVAVAGDWNEWQALPAQRADNGVWYLDLKLAPGRYRYAFRIDGKEWRIPDGAAAVDDEFGGKSAWLTVAVNADSRDAVQP